MEVGKPAKAAIELSSANGSFVRIADGRPSPWTVCYADKAAGLG